MHQSIVAPHDVFEGRSQAMDDDKSGSAICNLTEIADQFH